jgi:hypothetical protein
MRFVEVLGIAATVTGCASCDGKVTPPLGDGTPPSANRTLELASCQTMYGTQYAPPCTTFRSGTGERWVDSARVVLRRDFSASWMAASQMRSVPCGFSSCAETTRTTELAEGSYQIVGDTIRLTLTMAGSVQPRSLFGTFPPGMDSHWTGPDSLYVPGYSPTFTTLIFKPR